MSKKRKSIFTKKSDAGKGDSPRSGISIWEWEKRWEVIFGKKEKFIQSFTTDHSGSKS
jgi:hypothetical protein